MLRRHRYHMRNHSIVRVEKASNGNVPLKYRSAARLCRFIARWLASSCSTLYRTASGYRLSLNAFLCSACNRSRSFSSAAACFLNISARPMIESRLVPEMMLERALPISDKSGLRTESFSDGHSRGWTVVTVFGATGSSKGGGGSKSSRGSMISGSRSMLVATSVDETGSALRVWPLGASCMSAGMTTIGGTGLGVGTPSAASCSKESWPTSEECGMISKLTEEEEDGFGCDTERIALGGREVAGTGRRRAEVVDGVLEASVEEECEYPGKLPGTLCLR